MHRHMGRARTRTHRERKCSNQFLVIAMLLRWMCIELIFQSVDYQEFFFEN